MILVDGNAVGYAAQHGKPLYHEGREVQAIYQFIRSLIKIRERFRNDGQVLVLWDTKAQFRYDLCPEYKGTRRKTEDAIHAHERWKDQSRDVKRLLIWLGVPQVICPNFEADDLAGYYARQYSDEEVRLITGDGDWMQLVNSASISWHDMRGNNQKDVYYHNFQEVTGYKNTSAFVQGKALQGDVSDNISGVGGLGKKAAMEIINHYGDVYNLFSTYDDLPTGEFMKGLGGFPESCNRFRKKINDFCREGRHLFDRNIKLMSLQSGIYDTEMMKNLKIVSPDQNLERFEVVCRNLNFLSIIHRIDRMKIFEDLA